MGCGEAEDKTVQGETDLGKALSGQFKELM